MRADRVVPAVLVVGMAVAAVVSALCRRYLDALYWVGGAVLNLSVLLRP